MPRFTLPDIPYDYSSLEGYIDTQTMELHHQKHHQTYINTLNSEIDKLNMYNSSSLVEILQNIVKDQENQEQSLKKIRDNAGGHYNHSFFWMTMNPKSNVEDISKKLKEKIEESFGTFEEMKNKFNEKAVTVFGSGWAWLCYDTETGKLYVDSTSNQDNPVMFNENIVPILGLDVWEHAYYLKYQNKRTEYISNWWNVVDWEMVDAFYTEFAVNGRVVEIKDDGSLNL